MRTLCRPLVLMCLNAAAPHASSAAFVPPAKKPSLVVLDLDNTLWTPELYQLRSLQRRPGAVPVAGTDVELFAGARRVIESVRSSPEAWRGTSFAVASRTKSVSWATDLLGQFGLLDDFFDHVEIFPGDKRAHFRNLREKTGVPYGEMLFFDDSRDGRFGNCVPVSELGVLCVHCPDGIHRESVFHEGVERFAEWSGGRNTIVERDGSVSVVGTEKEDETSSKRFRGIVKKVIPDRGFGFIGYGGRNTKDVFFHFSQLPSGATVEQGDELSFVVTTDPRNGKQRATNVKIVSSSSSSRDGDKDADTVVMDAFSMNLPFAALLANGYKTLETRNGTMFTTYPEGTKMLLHVGRRTYPDGDRHVDVMRGGGLSDREISRLKALPEGYGRGMAVAIVELGRTFETTLEERSEAEFQRRVGAFGVDSGRRATEIRRVEYLKHGVQLTGQGGVFKASVPRSAIPDGWIDN